MIRTTLTIILLCVSFFVSGQTAPEHPDLGLHGIITWLDDTHIVVEYDWSDDSQLLDWSLTTGSTLVRGDGYVTITDGYDKNVRAMIWNQRIKCSTITAKDAAPLYTPGHLNFYSNLTFYDGNSQPNPGLGAVLVSFKNFWVHDGVNVGDIGAPFLAEGVAWDYEYTVSATGMTIKSSVDNVTYSYDAACVLELDRSIALGGWGGNTRWGKITIGGEIMLPWQHEPVPSDIINIQSCGSVFAPVIEVVGDPVVEWVFDDLTTSSSTTPVKDYGSSGSRHNFLKVTPWSALIGINVGYDAGDGGYGGFDLVSSQDVLGFQNLELAKSSLQYLCASYNQITDLDLSELEAIQFVELYRCNDLTTLTLGIHPVLERLCVEDCNLDNLDLSGCEGLEDLRCALNNFPSINWGSIGQSLWHICNRDNPQITENLPAQTQFPVLIELLNWNTNQTGTLECYSSEIRRIESQDNNYTSVDVSACDKLYKLYLSGNPLTSLNLGTADLLVDVRLQNCTLTESQVDYVLKTLDDAGKLNGYLDISDNEPPSIEGLAHYYSLTGKGWTIAEITGIDDHIDISGNIKVSVNNREIKMWLNNDFINWNATLYDFYGRNISDKPVDGDVLVFDVSSLYPGIYLIKLSHEKQRVIKKVIKP